MAADCGGGCAAAPSNTKPAERYSRPGQHQPYYLIWAVLIITLDVITIWALAAHRKWIHLVDS